MTLTDKCSKEEISIEYYKNGTLYLYGYTWSLGEEIINIITRITNIIVPRNIDKINELVHICNENYINDNGNSCNECSIECSRNCRQILRDIHYGGKLRYGCERVINYYVLRYIYKFSYEIEKHLNDYADIIDMNSHLNVLSIGCGPCTELLGIENFNKSLKKPLNYIGVDLNNEWTFIHELFKSKKQYNQSIRYIYADIFDYIKQINPKKKELITNLLIFQYVISDMSKYKSMTEMEEFFIKLYEEIIMYLPRNSLIIFNDINNNQLSNIHFEKVAKLFQENKYIVDKRHFESRYYNFPAYGESLGCESVPYSIQDYIEKRYNPHIECSSSSLIIRKV